MDVIIQLSQTAHGQFCETPQLRYSKPSKTGLATLTAVSRHEYWHTTIVLRTVPFIHITREVHEALFKLT